MGPCSGVLRAVTAAGGAALWAANGRPYEEAVALCVSLLDDPSAAAGDAAGAALGDLAAAAGSPAAAEAVCFRPCSLSSVYLRGSCHNFWTGTADPRAYHLCLQD